MKEINSTKVNLYDEIVWGLMPRIPGRYFDRKFVRFLEKSVGFIISCIYIDHWEYT